MKFSYKNSGVNTKKAHDYIFSLQKNILSTNQNLSNGSVISNFGGFAGIFKTAKKWENAAIVSTTDGVGTKIHLCNQWNYIEPLGKDLVAMCVNDLYCIGATPIFFLDYIACEKLDNKWYSTIMNSIVNSCKQTNMALLGGETAEHPGTMGSGNYDLAGFCVGLVNPQKTLPKIKEMQENDCIVAIPSSGFHSNGFSLIRKIFTNDLEWQKKLLFPTRIYEIIPKMLETVSVKGISHITGGGIYENLPRILPKDLCAYIEHPLYYANEIFQIFMSVVELKEMFSTWNMGIGMLMIIHIDQYKNLQKFFSDAKIIGYLKKQKKEEENQVYIRGIDYHE